MTKTKLKLLELSVFRGATKAVKIEFDPSKKLTMIFGESGNGKSSIVDAFGFICNENFGSLEDRSGTDKNLVTSILGKAEKLLVKLATDKGTWEASFKSGTKQIEVKPDGCPDAQILRRAKI